MIQFEAVYRQLGILARGGLQLGEVPVGESIFS